MLGILCPPGAATVIVFYRGTYIFGPADTQHPLVIDIDTMVVAKIIIDTSEAFVWMLCVDILHLPGYLLVLRRSAAHLAGRPLVVGGTGHIQQLTGRFNGISLFFVAFLDSHVNTALPYF